MLQLICFFINKVSMPEEAHTLLYYFKLILTLRITQEVDCPFALTYFYAF